MTDRPDPAPGSWPEVPNDPPWCRACGVESVGADDDCPACNWSLEPADLGPASIGHVVKVGGGIRSRWGVSLDESSGEIVVLVKDDESLTFDAEEFSGLPRREFPGSDLPSASGRLLALHRSTERGAIKGKWGTERPRSAGVSMATATVGRSRGAVHDWLVIDLGDQVDQLNLSASEVTWHRAVAAARAGALPAAVALLEYLPPTGYAARVDLVLSFVPHLLAEPPLAERAATVLKGLAQDGGHPVAAALVAVLVGGDLRTRVAAMATLADRLARRQAEAGAIAHRAAEALAHGSMADPGPEAGLPLTRAVALWMTGKHGGPLDDDVEALGPLPDSMIDDLIDTGALSAVSARSTIVAGSGKEYLKARLAPGALTIEEAHGLGFASEYARRLYKLGDLERLTQFPPGHADADHYITLLTLRNNPSKQARDGLRPEAQKFLDLVDTYLADLGDGRPAVPPEEILADPTSWPMLRGGAEKGLITLSPDERAAHPALAAWLDMLELQRLLFAGDWTRARSAGRDLIARLTEEVLRDEALNMTAFAEFMAGDAPAALALLEEALEGHHTAALVVNAAVVASELGAEPAAIFLSHIFDTATDPDVGLQALLKGIRVWLGDDDAEVMPAALVRSIRVALSRAMSDDSLLILLRMACNHDREWLAREAQVGAASEAQGDMVRYWTTHARALTDGSGVTADDLARVVAELNGRAVVPGWAATELTWLVDLLSGAVHTTFGEGAWTMGAIRVLAEARLLDLWQETVLMMQAGAHSACRYEESDSCLTSEAETTYVFTPYERWKARREDLPPKLIEAVDEEATRCLGMAGYCMYLITSRRVSDLSRRWQELVQRERWDAQNRLTILRAEHETLDEISGWLDRLRRYTSRVDLALVDEGQRGPWREVLRDLDGWDREIARLRALM